MATANSDAVQALIASIGDAIATAQAEAGAANATPLQVAASRQLTAFGQATILLLQRSQTAAAAPVTVMVGPTDTIFRIAQRYLGDFRRYNDIRERNSLAGIALFPGQILQLPGA